MLKINFNIAFIFLSSLASCFHAQNILTCGTDEVMAKWFSENPNIEKEYFVYLGKEKTRDSILGINRTAQKNATTASVYTVPVVFHILHQGGQENISDTQIYDELNILNRDYRKQNADTINIYPPFVPADTKIEFRLASKDTNGNCTTGIVRHYDINTDWTPFTQQLYKYTWNPARYLNIYVVKSIVGFSSGGYSSLPGLYTSPMDVIVIMNNSVGSIGTGNVLRSRIITHEVGHWLNLLHTWAAGGTYASVCGDDGVGDTPITKGFGPCLSSPTQAAVCNPPTQENFQNYMDYSACRYMFTPGQVIRMTAAINSTVGGRSNLWTNSNLIATGVINPTVPCNIIPLIHGDGFVVCQGSSITFTDISYNGTITARTWSASGNSTLSSVSGSITAVTFPSIGTETVTLTVSNGINQSADTKTVMVISPVANYSVNYQESFEGQGLPTFFSVINTDNDVTWTQTNLSAATGSNSFYINGSSDAPNTNPDILETPSYDFSPDPTATFTFKYAYARANVSNLDAFKVQASSDCGGNWFDIYAPSNNAMANASGGTINTPFFPSSPQYVTYTLTDHPNFSPFIGLPNVKIRFYFREDVGSGYGNNIFLDDINFNSSNSGVNEIYKSIGLKIYPNPSSGFFTIELELSDDALIQYRITDVVGRVVSESESVIFNSGKHYIRIDAPNLIPGLYFLRVNYNNREIIQKVIIK
jgi:hypothetical protein